MDSVGSIVIVGIVATALTDAWSLVRRRVLGVALPDFALVGRWIAHMRHGHFRHEAIARAPAVRFERALGWSAHYLIGIAFAALVPWLFGADWLRQPTPGPAVIVGLATVAAPFLLMQPGMGAGVAARRTPRPTLARLHSLATHAVFGVGLYLGALALVAWHR
jgi:hypothetical protein